jgi:hypothetical protein
MTCTSKAFSLTFFGGVAMESFSSGMIEFFFREWIMESIGGAVTESVFGRALIESVSWPKECPVVVKTNTIDKKNVAIKK